MITSLTIEKSTLRYRYPDDEIFFYRIISDIFVVRREITFTILDSIETSFPVATEIVRVVSLSTTEITETTRFKLIYRVGIP